MHSSEARLAVFGYTKMSLVDCWFFEMCMLHCRNSQVWLDYSSNGRRNCSSHCSSSEQGSMLLIDGNMTWLYDCPEKSSLNWEGWKTCWLPTANKTIGPDQDTGVITIQYNLDCYIDFLCSYSFQPCSSVLLVITLPYTQFLTWISKCSSSSAADLHVGTVLKKVFSFDIES